MIEADPVAVYVDLCRQMLALEERRQDDTPEADALLARLDACWYALDAQEQDRARRLVAEALNGDA